MNQSFEVDDGSSTDVLHNPAASSTPPRLRLSVISGPDRGAELILSRGTYLVGKDGGCALVLSDAAVSRQHLELGLTVEGVRVRDLGSKNGSLFNGTRFSEITVGSGAVIALGRTELRLLPESVRDGLPPSTRERFGGLIGRSLVMRQLFAMLERIASSDVAVLIEGDTGTGKELCAEAIHANSRRAQAPFVVCDLAGVARSLIEAELFGHVRGSFTGADRDREGAFVQANGGTIFIDEVGEMDIDIQPRLLRALERLQIKPVGGSSYRSVDVRVVAATNRDLTVEAKAGRFREDLFHRLAVVRVRLPNLRERKEDIPLLVAQFLSRGSAPGASDSRPPRALVPPETMALLANHEWPGNVRELKNVLDRALSLLPQAPAVEPEGGFVPSVITPELLGLGSSVSGAPAQAPSRFHEAKEHLIASWERNYLLGLLDRADGNISRAARDAGMDRVYLHRLLKKHRIGGGASGRTDPRTDARTDPRTESPTDGGSDSRAEPRAEPRANPRSDPRAEPELPHRDDDDPGPTSGEG